MTVGRVDQKSLLQFKLEASMAQKKDDNHAYQEGLFRYKIISDLLASPPEAGELATQLRKIASQKHLQPWSQEERTVTVRTLERWYAASRKAEKPPEALQPKLRKDRGSVRKLCTEHFDALALLKKTYSSWSVQLIYDNFCAIQFVTQPPSYSTVLRYLKSIGYSPTSSKIRRHKLREIRSFEVEFVGQMWHMDFHKGSRMVVTEDGKFVQPICAAFIDDKSRLVCHAQWFLNETTEVLVHSLMQAILKRGLPRTFYTDNGAAMKGEELKAGLEVLGIKHETTLPYSPYQNGKQESFWQPLEGRLMKMIPKEKRITLDVLNRVTQAWIEQDYHDRVHSETKEKPIDRFFNSPSVIRPGVSFDDLRRSFRMRTTRTIRKTDGTITLDGVRFEVPQSVRHLQELTLRYARWDLGEAEILCPTTFKSMFTILPLNRLANSTGARKETGIILEDVSKDTKKEEILLDLSTHLLPPLLARCLQKHAEQFPMAGYLPLENRNENT